MGLLSFYHPVDAAGIPGEADVFITGVDQAEQVAWILVNAGYENIRITRDTGGIDRVVEGQKPHEIEEAEEEG